jgi:hypothetical protein
MIAYARASHSLYFNHQHPPHGGMVYVGLVCTMADAMVLISMSNKAQIKLKNKAQTKEGGRADLRGLGPPWNKKVEFEALARVKIQSPARRQRKGLPGSTACRCVSPFSGHRM